MSKSELSRLNPNVAKKAKKQNFGRFLAEKNDDLKKIWVEPAQPKKIEKKVGWAGSTRISAKESLIFAKEDRLFKTYL